MKDDIYKRFLEFFLTVKWLEFVLGILSGLIGASIAYALFA